MDFTPRYQGSNHAWAFLSPSSQVLKGIGQISGKQSLLFSNLFPPRGTIVKKLAQENGLSLVLDVVKTGFIESSGLQALLSLRTTLTMNQVDMKIGSPTPKVLETYQLTRLHRLF